MPAASLPLSYKLPSRTADRPGNVARGGQTVLPDIANTKHQHHTISGENSTSNPQISWSDIILQNFEFTYSLTV
jgi:hypothetical protein